MSKLFSDFTLTTTDDRLVTLVFNPMQCMRKSRTVLWFRHLVLSTLARANYFWFFVMLYITNPRILKMCHCGFLGIVSNCETHHFANFMYSSFFFSVLLFCQKSQSKFAEFSTYVALAKNCLLNTIYELFIHRFYPQNGIVIQRYHLT